MFLVYFITILIHAYFISIVFPFKVYGCHFMSSYNNFSKVFIQDSVLMFDTFPNSNIRVHQMVKFTRRVKMKDWTWKYELVDIIWNMDLLLCLCVTLNCAHVRFVHAEFWKQKLLLFMCLFLVKGTSKKENFIYSLFMFYCAWIVNVLIWYDKILWLK